VSKPCVALGLPYGERLMAKAQPRVAAARAVFVGATPVLFALVMLIGQFLLGMAVNLFVKIPDQHPGANPPEYFSGVVQSVTWAILHGNVWLGIHAGYGLVLVAAAIGTLVQAIGNRRRGIVVCAALGLIGVLGAGFNGGSFLNYNQDFSSMLMAAGTAIAMISYSVGLYIADDSASATPAAA
jgi:hypothetical protein